MTFKVIKLLNIITITCLVVLLNATTLIAADIVLSWNPPTTNEDGSPLTDLAGYRIYYGNTSGNYSNIIDTGNVTSSQLKNLEDNATYYFVVTAYDRSGNESSDSNEVSKTTVPIPGTSCGEGYIWDCTYNCENATWLGDNICDDDTTDSNINYADFTCMSNDNGDCDNGINPGDSCGAGMIYDCIGNCEKATWLGDNTCDNDMSDLNPDYADFTCMNNDNGDCDNGITPGDSCGAGMIYDCIGNCEKATWLGDYTCDNDTSDSRPDYADFTCMNNDNGDCN